MKRDTVAKLRQLSHQLREQKLYAQLFSFARQEGVSLYMVGGAVRDLLFFQHLPTDVDLAVPERALEFAQSFARRIRGVYVLLDAAERTARVVYQKRITFDFTQFRAPTIEADLKERDFTINAMALPLDDLMTGASLRLIDPYGGEQDLEAGIIRMVASHSIRSDPLRMVRAYRFAAQFGFTVAETTEEEIGRCLPLLARVSAERVHDELLKLLGTPRATSTLRQMERIGLLYQLFPELEAVGDSSLPEYVWTELQGLEQILHHPAARCGELADRIQGYLSASPHRLPLLKLGLLLARSHLPEKKEPKAMAAWWEEVGERLRFSRADIRFVHHLLAHHPSLAPLLSSRPPERTRILYRLFKEAGDAVFGLFLWEMGRVSSRGSDQAWQHTFGVVQQSWQQLDTQIIPLLKRPRLLTGNDLQQVFALKPGPRFREILQEAEEAEVRGEIQSKAEALHWVRRRFGLAFSEEAW
ncbi:MAG: CCA tRNA nucleotidyltransferase [Nitrospinota bacterium]|nr:MAG: CCA tRNA nucleotidyltransferase [Nitrospinota bacterium]